MARGLGRVSDPIHGRSGVIQSIQRATHAGSGTGNGTITAVDLERTALNYLGESQTATGNSMRASCLLTSTTNVRTQDIGGGGTITHGYTVIEREW